MIQMAPFPIIMEIYYKLVPPNMPVRPMGLNGVNRQVAAPLHVRGVAISNWPHDACAH